MNRREFLKTSILGGSAAGLLAFQPDDRPVPYIPGHVESTDPLWGILHGAKVTIDDKRGLMTAEFTDVIKKLDGEIFTIGGFILPIDSKPKFSHFILTRRNSSCPFCPPNEPTEAIEIFATQALEYTPNDVTITGKMKLVAESDAGLFYQLSDAIVRSEE